MNESDDELARSLGRVLHELPLRSAPATLEVRVLAELERRAKAFSEGVRRGRGQ